jgi:hypothetical protein
LVADAGPRTISTIEPPIQRVVMTKACPIPTPGQRRYGEIQSRIEDAMMTKIYAALQEATDQARTEMQAADLNMPPPSAGYFGSVIHQSLFCTLCKADPKTFSGGDADIAIAIIRNMQKVAKHYWSADIEPHARNVPS